LRFEDLDRVTSSADHIMGQTRDLEAIGIDWDDTLVQSDRFDAHHDAIMALVDGGHTFECFCTRREIAEAAHAPNGIDGIDGARLYPGTCRELTSRQRSALASTGRPPALRLRGHAQLITINDRFCGPSEHVVDDVVLRRNDGVPAYNLAVVVDDAFQGVEEAVRADDLLSSTAPQRAIAALLNIPSVSYVHIPLVVNADGKRLAKRDGAVTLADLAAKGVGAGRVRSELLASLGIEVVKSVSEFRLANVPRGPFVFSSIGLADGLHA
jgi:glutamyl-tRNA synthetase